MALGRQFLMMLMIQIVCLKLGRHDNEAKLVVDVLMALAVLTVWIIGGWLCLVELLEMQIDRALGVRCIISISGSLAALYQLFLSIQRKPVGIGNLQTTLQLLQLLFGFAIIHQQYLMDFLHTMCHGTPPQPSTPPVPIAQSTLPPPPDQSTLAQLESDRSRTTVPLPNSIAGSGVPLSPEQNASISPELSTRNPNEANRPTG